MGILPYIPTTSPFITIHYIVMLIPDSGRGSLEVKFPTNSVAQSPRVAEHCDVIFTHSGFGRSFIPYAELEDEHGSTSEEVKLEPMITFDCAYCDYRSPTPKGLRCHRLTVHRIGLGWLFRLQVLSPQSLSGHDQVYLQPCSLEAIWTTSLVISVPVWAPSTLLTALFFSGCLDCKFSDISYILDTIKSI
ncbi:uncharacterized protein TNCV_1848701 [Trichonephila clavipes]|nr:uncharacterized protein TNCV_1848701 [Trichonephila clavipes]